MKTIAVVGAGPGLGRSIAVRFAREGLRVAVVSRDQTKLDRLADELGQPVEIAHAALHLASDDSSDTTGTVLVADGGSSVGISPPEQATAKASHSL